MVGLFYEVYSMLLGVDLQRELAALWNTYWSPLLYAGGTRTQKSSSR